jgi:cbb3-type cytochrome oxidase maturation protein
MEIIIILIIISLLVAISFLVAFLWAVKSGQFEDRYTPSVRVLFDEEKKIGNNNKKL